MTDDLRSFYSWLFSCLPASASEIMADLQLGHRAMPKEYAGMPRDALELTKALRSLERSGLLEIREHVWYWKAEAAVERREAQASLF